MRNKDLDWLKFKAKELSNLATKEPITSEKTFRWHSICYPLFNEFEEISVQVEIIISIYILKYILILIKFKC